MTKVLLINSSEKVVVMKNRLLKRVERRMEPKKKMKRTS